MQEVRLSSPFDLLQKEYIQIAQLIKAYDRFNLSTSVPNGFFLLDSLFEKYTLRQKYFSQDKDAYLYVKISSHESSQLNDIDAELVRQVAYATCRTFSNLEDVKSFINDTNKRLILAFAASHEVIDRLMLTYSVLFSNTLCCIRVGELPSMFFNQTLILNFSESFVAIYIRDCAEKLGIEFNSKWELSFMKEDILQAEKQLVNLHVQSLKKIFVAESAARVLPVKEEVFVNISQTKYKSQTNSVISEVPSTLSITVDKPSKEVEVILTEREELVYNELQKHKFISRKSLAEVVWGQGKEVKDDAIDQFVSRLRRKFVQAGYDKAYITSKKGEGISLLSK